MRAILVTFLLVTTVLAGCASAPLEPEIPIVEEAVSDALTFGGNATREVIGEVQYLMTGHNGPEPNVGITSAGNIFVSAGPGSSVIRSQDNGTTWDVVHTHQALDTDPMLWVDPWTDCIYHAPMFPILLGATLYVSCDEGNEWSLIQGQNLGRGVYDHQKLASALPGPDAAPIVGVAHPTSLIICYNALAYTNCAVSFDGGLTWPHDGPIHTSFGPSEGGGECAGQQSHPTGAPDGTIVVAKAWGCNDPWVFVSTDNGITWTQRAGPAGVGADTLDPEIAFTDDGSMYMLWQSHREESHAYLARSDDMGRSWSGPWNVTPPGMSSTIFASLHAGTPGRVAMAFHATNESGAPVNVPDTAEWYSYVVTTENGNTADPTFVALRAQEEPIQIGGICKGNRGCQNGNRNLLDFIDGAIGPDGTFYTIIADGCLAECEAQPSPGASRSREAALIRLDGWSLYA